MGAGASLEDSEILRKLDFLNDIDEATKKVVIDTGKMLDKHEKAITSLVENMNLLHKQVSQLEHVVFAMPRYKEYRNAVEQANARAVMANKFGNRDVLSLEPVYGLQDMQLKYTPLTFNRSPSNSSTDD
jgi:hypothetical protein